MPDKAIASFRSVFVYFILDIPLRFLYSPQSNLYKCVISACYLDITKHATIHEDGDSTNVHQRFITAMAAC